MKRYDHGMAIHRRRGRLTACGKDVTNYKVAFCVARGHVITCRECIAEEKDEAEKRFRTLREKRHLKLGVIAVLGPVLMNNNPWDVVVLSCDAPQILLEEFVNPDRPAAPRTSIALNLADANDLSNVLREAIIQLRVAKRVAIDRRIVSDFISTTSKSAGKKRLKELNDALQRYPKGDKR